VDFCVHRLQMFDTLKETQSRTSVMLQSQEAVCFKFMLSGNTFLSIANS